MNQFSHVPGVGKPNIPRHTVAPIPYANILQSLQIRIVHITADRTLETTPRLTVARIQMSAPTATPTHILRGNFVQ